MARDTLYRPPDMEDTQVVVESVPDLYGADTLPQDVVPFNETVVWGTESTAVSSWAVAGLIVSVVGLCATLTGLLAAEGAALGVLGLLVSIGGMVASGRPGVNGRGVAGLGAFIGVVAVALAVVAATGRLSWLNSGTNEITTWHAWLAGHWARLGHR